MATLMSGAISAAVETSGRVLSTLPGQFLALCLINACFVVGLLWFLERQSDARERVITAIVTSCLRNVKAGS